MKFELDLSKIAPACKDAILRSIRDVLGENITVISRDITYYTGCGAASIDMEGWLKEAQILRMHLINQIRGSK